VHHRRDGGADALIEAGHKQHPSRRHGRGVPMPRSHRRRGVRGTPNPKDAPRAQRVQASATNASRRTTGTSEGRRDVPPKKNAQTQQPHPPQPPPPPKPELRSLSRRHPCTLTEFLDRPVPGWHRRSSPGCGRSKLVVRKCHQALPTGSRRGRFFCSCSRRRRLVAALRSQRRPQTTTTSTPAGHDFVGWVQDCLVISFRYHLVSDHRGCLALAWACRRYHGPHGPITTDSASRSTPSE